MYLQPPHVWEVGSIDVGFLGEYENKFNLVTREKFILNARIGDLLLNISYNSSLNEGILD